MAVELNKEYNTVGGWKAKVIWICEFSHLCYVIHKPETKDETYPVVHNKYDGKSATPFSVYDRPVFDKQHPSDLIIPLE